MDLIVNPHRIADMEALDGILGAPGTISPPKELSRLDQRSRAFVQAAPFAILATSGPDGFDALPRCGPAGFIMVEDETTLLIPDRRDENPSALRNVVSDSRIALLFMIPDKGETLRVKGRAVVSIDPALLSRFPSGDKAPRCVVKVHVEAAIRLCTGVLHTRRLHPGRKNDRSGLPALQAALREYMEYMEMDQPNDREVVPDRLRITLY